MQFNLFKVWFPDPLGVNWIHFDLKSPQNTYNVTSRRVKLSGTNNRWVILPGLSYPGEMLSSQVTYALRFSLQCNVQDSWILTTFVYKNNIKNQRIEKTYNLIFLKLKKVLQKIIKIKEVLPAKSWSTVAYLWGLY